MIHKQLDELEESTPESTSVHSHKSTGGIFTRPHSLTPQPTRGQRNLFSCYIDYAKAFDSVPHTWLIDILHLYRIDLKLIKASVSAGATSRGIR